MTVGMVNHRSRKARLARLARLSAGLLLIACLVAACGGSTSAGEKTARLPGTSLDGAPAPDFRLTDQLGRSVALSDQRGRPVVLTFLYTTCPDFCPLTAEKLRQTLERLGADAGKVTMLAVSVDPERDTAAAAKEFSAQHRLPDDTWHYLVGTEAELAPVWLAYGIGRLPRGAVPTVGAAASDVLGHTEALYVLDTQGRERTLLRGDFSPDDLAKGLRTLFK
jgi:protein SCO1/2